MRGWGRGREFFVKNGFGCEKIGMGCAIFAAANLAAGNFLEKRGEVAKISRVGSAGPDFCLGFREFGCGGCDFSPGIFAALGFRGRGDPLSEEFRVSLRRRSGCDGNFRPGLGDEIGDFHLLFYLTRREPHLGRRVGQLAI